MLGLQRKLFCRNPAKCLAFFASQCLVFEVINTIQLILKLVPRLDLCLAVVYEAFLEQSLPSLVFKRYHTPPRSRSHSESEDDDSSETPPHWKEEMQRLRAYRPPSGEKWSKGDK